MRTVQFGQTVVRIRVEAFCSARGALLQKKAAATIEVEDAETATYPGIPAYDAVTVYCPA